MNYRSLFKSAKYLGKAFSTKNVFQVYECQEKYFIMTAKNDTTGYYNIIEKKAVTFIHKRLSGIKSISSTEGYKKCSGSKFVPDSFVFRNAMYILCAMKFARVSKVVGNTMYFAINKYS